MKKKLDILFNDVKMRFIKWLEKKPTGSFIVEITVNNGGIRGKPKISITEDI